MEYREWMEDIARVFEALGVQRASSGAFLGCDALARNLCGRMPRFVVVQFTPP